MNAPDRRKFIGGSDAAAVLGVSPWRTPYQLWLDKTQPAMPENRDAQRERILARGKRLEPVVLEMAGDELGLQVLHANRRFVDAEHPFLACEIDAEGALPGERGQVNVEVKTVHPFAARHWGDEGTDAAPVYYTAQAMHGLMITGRAVCVFLVLVGADDLRMYRVERDDETITALRAREVAFWRDHVETLIPPPDANAVDTDLRFAHDAGTEVEADGDTMAALSELRALMGERDEIEKRIDGVRTAIKRAIGPAAVLTVAGRRAASWRNQVQHRFDARAFQSTHPELYDKFLRAIESRVFRLL